MQILPEFDPELHPIGYALARYLLGESAREDRSHGGEAAMSTRAFDRFGWEFDIAAA